MGLDSIESPDLQIGQRKNENQAFSLALTLTLVNDCSCKVCKLLRKAQKKALTERVEKELNDE